MLGALIGAGASLLGKVFDNNKGEEQAAANRASQERIHAENIAQQREFAQQGIRWKVADAQAAGLHPLAALGAQTSSFTNNTFSPIEGPKSSFGDMGQDIGRAIDAGSSQAERQDRMGQAIARTAQLFSLEKLNLENEMLKTGIAKQRSQIPPPFPIPLPRPGPLRTTGGHAVKDDDIKQKAEDVPPVATNRFFGLPLDNPSWQSSGQAWEDQFGEYAGGALGIANLPASIGYTLYNRAVPDWETIRAAAMSGSGQRIPRNRKPWRSPLERR